MHNYLYNSLWDNPGQYEVVFDNDGASINGGTIEEATVTAFQPKPKKATIPGITFTTLNTKIPINPMSDSFSKQEKRELNKDVRWANRAERELRQQERQIDRMFNSADRWANRQERKIDRQMSKEIKLNSFEPDVDTSFPVPTIHKNDSNNFKTWSEGRGANTISAIKGVGNIAGMYANSDNEGWTRLVNSGIDTAMNLNPATAIANAALNVVNAGLKAGGFETPTISKNDAELLNLKGTRNGSNIAKALKLDNLLSLVAGEDLNVKNTINDGKALGAYSGTVAKHDAYSRIGGRHYAQKNAIRSWMNTSDLQVANINDISYDAKRMESNYAPQLYAANNQMIYNGYTPGLTLNKHGGTIPELNEVRSIMQSLQSKKQETQEPQKFQLGGKMNMIVTGALHARKHNLEELNPNLEGEITKKGVPVVVMNKGGEVQNQQAEVESQELVLQIDATKTIEDYYDEYNSTDSKTEKNKIALECGKYLVEELLKNTDDPDKLIKKTV